MEPNHFYEWRLGLAQPCYFIYHCWKIGGGDCVQVPFQPFIERNAVWFPEPFSEER